MSGEVQRPRFDPRHDAIFQRGYRPGDEHTTDTTRTDAASSVTETSAIDTWLAEASGTGTSPDSSPLDETGPLVEEPRSNPFIRALWIVGVAMIVFSVALQWQATTRNGFGSNYDPNGGMRFDQLLLQMVWFLASPMLLVGTLTVVALLFWHAVQWRAGSHTTGTRTTSERGSTRT